MTIDIRDETPRDRNAIRVVHRQAFRQEEEGKLVDTLRAGGYSVASLVAGVHGEVVGHVLFSALPVTGSAGTVPGAALAPLAVLPAYQRQGIGTRLVEAGLERCRAAGIAAVFVLGDPTYYRRFGFSSGLAGHVRSPYAGEAFMALELISGSLTGEDLTVHYPAPFADLD